MKEIIKIEYREGKRVCDARELHMFLNVKTRFNDWIKARIDKYGFEENADYILLTEKIVSGNNANAKTYIITIDMAKELSMVENNEKGKQARKYFIECERKLKENILPDFTNPAIAAREWATQYEKRIEAENLNIENKPKVEFYEAVTGSSDTVEMKEVAKILNIDGLGRNNLFVFLRNKKVLDRNNQPYQRFVDMGYFRLIESKYYVLGEVKINTKTVVYQKGIDYIKKLIDKSYE